MTAFLIPNSERSIMLMDSRVKDACSNCMEISYATNPQFSAVATTENGEWFVGSRTGQGRLYDGKDNGKNFKRAKNALPLCRDPITHGDCHKNFVVATTDEYLIFVDATDPATGASGFTRTIRGHLRTETHRSYRAAATHHARIDTEGYPTSPSAAHQVPEGSLHRRRQQHCCVHRQPRCQVVSQTAIMWRHEVPDIDIGARCHGCFWQRRRCPVRAQEAGQKENACVSALKLFITVPN